MTLSHWIEEQKKLCEGATKEKWEFDGRQFTVRTSSNSYMFLDLLRPGNAEWVIASRTSLPKALEIIEEMRKALDEMSKVQYGLEFSHSDEEAAEYWSMRCIGLRRDASEALRRADEIVEAKG